MRHVYRFTIAVSLLLLAIVSLTCSSKGHLVNSTVNRDGAAEDQTKSPLPFADGQLITSDGVVMHDQGAQTDHNLPGKSEGGVAKDSGSSVTNVCKTPPPTSYNPLSSYTPPKLQATIKVSTLSDSGPNSLREVLKNAPDAAVIGFDPGLAGKTIALNSPLVLSRSVTIDGSAAPGISIDVQKNGSGFSFNGDGQTRLAFFSLRILNGYTQGSGGAITTNGGNLEVEIGGCRFENNAAGEGGAIRVGYYIKSKTFIHDSVFINNDGTLTNSGFSGGAISATGTKLHIARCRFENNQGSTSGAVYAIHSDPLVEDSVFIKNSSVGSGGAGALFTDGGGPGDDNNPGSTPGKNVILRSRFEDNRGAGTDGGAIMLWGYPMDVLTIEDSIFYKNHCDLDGKGGGAKIHARNKLRIARTAFVENIATQQGGGIWLDGEGPFDIENVLFAKNQAQNDRGGGATFNVSGKVTLTNVTFTNNAGGQGCGAFWINSEQNDVHLKNSIVAFNTGKNNWEIQVGYPPLDDGGNIEWPDPQAGKRVAKDGLLTDPKLDALTQADGTFVQLPSSGSPAISHAVSPAPSLDLRGAPRDSKPDTGAFEAGATCK